MGCHSYLPRLTLNYDPPRLSLLEAVARITGVSHQSLVKMKLWGALLSKLNHCDTWKLYETQMYVSISEI
jgi:hypothetical protein